MSQLKRYLKENQGNNIVWYGLRFGFYGMLVIWFISTIYYAFYPTLLGIIFRSYIVYTFALFVFILSVIHLSMYATKALAIISLIIAFLILIGPLM